MDRHARFCVLFRDAYPALHRYARHRGLSAEDAEDLAAGTLVALGGSGSGGGLRPAEVVSSADLLAKMTTAAGQVAGDVVEGNGVQGHATTQSWGAWNLFAAHAIYRYDGRICFETRETATLLTVVDHVTRTWWTRPVPRSTWLSPQVSGCKLTRYIATPLALLEGVGAVEGADDGQRPGPGEDVGGDSAPRDWWRCRPRQLAPGRSERS
jgi:hypothetical protein